jgi:hypothetical protein
MLKCRLLDSLKLKQEENVPDEVISEALFKMEKQKRLSSKEFLKVYDTLRQEGPSAKLQNPDLWFKQGAGDYY